MKSIIGFLVLMTVTTAFAREQYVCQEKGNRTSPRTMTLTQLSSGRVQEGVKHLFGLELRDRRTGTVLFAARVNVEVEDVMFSFSNRQGEVTGMIYLDELDQSWAEFGRNKLRFDCGAGR